MNHILATEIFSGLNVVQENLGIYPVKLEPDLSKYFKISDYHLSYWKRR
jgi:hypothetical protein